MSHRSINVGSTSTWAVIGSTSCGPLTLPAGQWMNNGTRCPPSYSLPFLPRMPALKTLSPDDVPLSVVKIKIVFSVKPFLVQKRTQLADVVVDVGDHAEEIRQPNFLVLVRLAELFGRVHRAVRGVGGDVGQKRFARFLLDLMNRLA